MNVRKEISVRWKVLSIAQSTDPSRDDEDFEQWIGMFQEPSTDCMSRFVVGNCLLFVLAQNSTLPFQSNNHALDRTFKVLLQNILVVFSGGVKGSFVANIRDIGTRKARSENSEFGGERCDVFGDLWIQA